MRTHWAFSIAVLVGLASAGGDLGAALIDGVGQPELTVRYSLEVVGMT